MVLDPADATEEKVTILQQPLVLQDATNTLGDWLKEVLGTQEISLTSNPANYQRLTMPALILWGSNDTVIPLAEGNYLNSLILGSERRVMQGVNHIPHLEDPDRFIRLVLEFLAESTF